MKQLIAFTAFLLGLSIAVRCQPDPGDTLARNGKRKIDHTHYDSWKSIGRTIQSKSGSIVSYSINPSRGDGILYLEKIDGSIKKEFSRGKGALIHHKEAFFVFGIKPEFDTVRQKKLDEVKKDMLPKDSLGIYWLAIDSLRLIPKIKSFALSEEGDWLAYLSTEDLREDCPDGKKKKKKKKKKKGGCEKKKTTGKTLTVYNPLTAKELVIHQVVDYEFNRNGTLMAFTTSEEGEKDSLDVKILDLASLSITTFIEKQMAVVGIEFDYRGEQLAFLATADTNEKKNFALHYWKGNSGSIKSNVLVDSTISGMPDGWTVSEFEKPWFSRDGSKLYCGTNKIVEQDPEDSLLDGEKAKVDVWSHFDDRIQPEQLLRKKRDLEKAYEAVYHLQDNKFVQLETEKYDGISYQRYGNIDVALIHDDSPYLKERSWSYPWREDIYYMDLRSGDAVLLVKGVYDRVSISPSGEYFIWFDVTDSSWYGKHVNEREEVELTKGIDATWISDNNGQPSHGWSKGMAGWTLIDGHEYALINSEFDVYAFSPANPQKVVAVTGGSGKKENVSYRVWRKEYDSIYVDLEQTILRGVHEVERWSSISNYQLDVKDRPFVRTELLKSDHQINWVLFAEDSDQCLLRRQSFTDYPELESCQDDMKNPKKLTLTNPGQENLNWGTIERVKWKSYKGKDLVGILYKPEDFDSTKKYPMIVYFYEKYQSRYHAYYSPRATASIIYPTEYCSNGYIVFIPDVLYEPGHPGKSAYDCIVSGTDYLTNKYSWIDTTKLGLQGQSWGGYQTAQLITMTNKYAAAMAGAPVSNMFSAFGGIRWGSGLSREFQYERTQSRIGHTIWDRPDLYIENSPVFHLTNVETPCLIMHNDKDGAVPWYQGIEMFMGLRRLGKEVWMLNYNGDAHNLIQLANKKDLSIRMRQFFDYYLLGADIPKWMKDGVPAVDKGKDYGLELIETDR